MVVPPDPIGLVALVEPALRAGFTIDMLRKNFVRAPQYREEISKLCDSVIISYERLSNMVQPLMSERQIAPEATEQTGWTEMHTLRGLSPEIWKKLLEDEVRRLYTIKTKLQYVKGKHERKTLWGKLAMFFQANNIYADLGAMKAELELVRLEISINQSNIDGFRVLKHHLNQAEEQRQSMADTLHQHQRNQAEAFELWQEQYNYVVDELTATRESREEQHGTNNNMLGHILEILNGQIRQDDAQQRQREMESALLEAVRKLHEDFLRVMTGLPGPGAREAEVTDVARGA